MYFGSERKFTEFANFVELGHFIKHLRDHELSVVYHANHDYSSRAVERTQAVFENGIDVCDATRFNRNYIDIPNEKRDSGRVCIRSLRSRHGGSYTT